jgi:Signal peptide binding domain
MSTEFTLDDFAEQLRHLRGMTTTRPDMLSEVMDYFRDDRQQTLDRADRILAALRPEERREPGPVGSPERLRISAESGLPGPEVDRFFAFRGGCESSRVWASSAVSAKFWTGGGFSGCSTGCWPASPSDGWLGDWLANPAVAGRYARVSVPAWSRR